MDPGKQIVTKLPLDELWHAGGPLRATRLRMLQLPDLQALLGAGPMRFVVANVGGPLRWVPLEDTFSFWKGEARPRLADPDGAFVLEHFPDGVAYVASFWTVDGEPAPIILLEAHH